MTVGSAYEAVKEALLKKADVPHDILKSSDWINVVDDHQPAGLESPAVSVTLSPPAGRPVPPVTGLFEDLADADGDVRRPGGSGLCSSAVDLHKTGLSSAAALKRRFLRSRSHQSLPRLDVRAAVSPSDSRDRVATATPRLFASRSPRLLPTCVRRPRDDEADHLSTPLDSAIRASGAMILNICGIDISPSSNAAVNSSSSVRALDV